MMRTYAGRFPALGVGCGLLALGLFACGGSKPTTPGSGCDPTASPMDQACVVSETYGIFASAGATGGVGSRGAPFGRLSKAVAAAAKDHKRVYACAGTYPEHLTLDLTDDGLEIYGGFDCGSWKPRAGKTTVAPTDAGPALHVAGTDGLRLEDLDFVALAGAHPGESSVGAVVDNALQVRLEKVGITAGAGVDGKDGPPLSVTQARDGLPGKDGVAACRGNPNPGGAAVDLDCGTGTTEGGAGGRGGVGGGSAYSGNNGFPLILDGNGGLGDNGSASWSCAVGGTGGGGQGGANGSEGVDGAGGTGLGRIAGDGYHGADGEDGTNGGNGQGGGGGGGALAPGGTSKLVCTGLGVNTGAGGGSGGTGGCGGLGGAGGQAGGSSIALISLDSGLVLDHCRLTAGKAGAGGSGATGQIHGSGGAAGQGGARDATGAGLGGCSGGQGGEGGNGGGGGGGQGGHSLGVAYYGHAPTLTSTPITRAGAGGQGGTGGQRYQHGNGGADGVAADVQRF